MSENLSGRYSQKLIDHAKKSAADAIQKTATQKTAEVTGDLIGNKIENKITNFLRTYHRIIQKRLQMKEKILDLIEKYQGKDIYLQKECKKLLMT